MSNCIEIHNDVVLSSKHFDCARLLTDVTKHKDDKQSFDLPLDDQNFYWFLTPTSVYQEGDDIILSLGSGRSSHTWRDLKQTLHTLALYAKTTEHICLPLIISNEFDGFETEGQYNLEVKRLN